MPAPVVRLTGVTFGYEGVPVIEDADLEIAAGDFTSIIGPNGGGKTTLLKLILGIVQPSRGAVRVFERPPAQVRPRIGYLPQISQHDPLFPVTAMDVILMGRLTAGAAGPYSRADRRAAQRALAEVGLPDLRGRRMADLSGGQRQRVLVARALCSDPDLLLLDEPTAGVDSPAEERLLELLRGLNSRMTILMVSHDLGFVSQFVRHVICVNRRVRVHAMSDLTGEHIRELYGAPVRMVHHDGGGGE
jgi:zinc transport system ATP-binding protein